jgi:uncharacterized protein (DUF3084 family)
MIQLELDDFERSQYEEKISDLEYEIDRLKDQLSEKDGVIEDREARIEHLENALDAIAYDAREALR